VLAGVEWYRLPRPRVGNCRRDRPRIKEGMKSAMIARVAAARVYMIVRVDRLDFWMVEGVVC
jgi:hypothetical protein